MKKNEEQRTKEVKKRWGMHRMYAGGWSCTLGVRSYGNWRLEERLVVAVVVAVGAFVFDVFLVHVVFVVVVFVVVVVDFVFVGVGLLSRRAGAGRRDARRGGHRGPAARH